MRLTNAAPAETSSASAAVWTPFLLLCVIAAAAAIRRIVALALPQTTRAVTQLARMDANFASRRGLTLAHIVPALVLVMLLPLWFSRRVRARSGVHRALTLALFWLE